MAKAKSSRKQNPTLLSLIAYGLGLVNVFSMLPLLAIWAPIPRSLLLFLIIMEIIFAIVLFYLASKLEDIKVGVLIKK